jgi:hypothetical protein
LASQDGVKVGPVLQAQEERATVIALAVMDQFVLDGHAAPAAA